ncbi:hypothetical protein GCM10010218_36390 [Streptomyces mashuensis]|uniref:HTH arsR-type domain-containing protein n=1 Tax=Streptomyces mashuensis TaxID=33904 RepID=A0A919B4M3_9ACTN|nr:hypothetical protein GCM10010218_36390 [Streptomyces mashuensis]
MAAGVGSFGRAGEPLGRSGDGPYDPVPGPSPDPSSDVLAEAAAAFGLLASPARLHLVWALSQGESDVSGLAQRVGGALPAVSQHLAKLKLAGLVRSRREGRRVVYLVDDPQVVAVVRLMVGQLNERRDLPLRVGSAAAR